VVTLTVFDFDASRFPVLIYWASHPFLGQSQVIVLGKTDCEAPLSASISKKQNIWDKEKSQTFNVDSQRYVASPPTIGRGNQLSIAASLFLSCGVDSMISTA
jgi:hypothetical protein